MKLNPNTPLGIPAGSVRAIITIILTAAFAALHFFGLQALIDKAISLADFIALVGSFNAIYTMCMFNYFKTREETGKVDENGTQPTEPKP